MSCIYHGSVGPGGQLLPFFGQADLPVPDLGDPSQAAARAMDVIAIGLDETTVKRGQYDAHRLFGEIHYRVEAPN